MAQPSGTDADDEILRALGQRLLDARLDFGRRLTPIRSVSQKEVGAMLDVTGVTVGAWEAGKNDPGLPMLYRLADIYGVRRAWLATGDGPMRYEEPRRDASELAHLVAPPSAFRRVESGDDLRRALGEAPKREQGKSGRKKRGNGGEV